MPRPSPIHLLAIIGILATALAIALEVGGGGGGGGGGDEPAVEGTVAEIPGSADPEAARVIEEWSEALRDGDVEAAAEYFEIPSIVQNGTPPLPLASREEVIAFNQALPCGAELSRAESEGRFTIATFELTERPGPGECGAGTGGTAKTAFVIEDGLIREWRRVADQALPEPPGDSPIV